MGINKLVVKLSNRTADHMPFKVKVLELATRMRALLEADETGRTEDLLIVDLASRTQPE